MGMKPDGKGLLGNLPRNVYTRVCARRVGHLQHRAWHGNSGGDYWASLSKIEDLQVEILRWQKVPWCPEWLGAGYNTGEVTLTGLARTFFIPFAFVTGVATGVVLVIYGIMTLGASVLR